MNFVKFQVKNFRSLKNVEVSLIEGYPIVISGENNIGKTNFLRALNIFFNHIHDNNLYNPEVDIPHHIYHGSRGGRTKTELIGEFIDTDGSSQRILVHFDADGSISYKINNRNCSELEAHDKLSKFHFFFIESHNIHLPTLISTILEKDGLLALDKKRKRQSAPLEKLKEFIELSKIAINDIEREINNCFKELTDFDGFLKDTQILINFAEFEKLRDVVKTMTSITLHDGNNHEIESKGSGVQRAVFLSLMKYISKNIKNKQVIWAIDEPEAFLQPKLQRQVFNTLKKMCLDEKQVIILTTHSPQFINLNHIDSVNLFIGRSELKEYRRKPGTKFHEIDTQNFIYNSVSDKVKAIKEHLGIKNNDGWEILPFNILVEGEEDKKYLEKLIEATGKDIPNIIWAGGASKIAGYLQYYNNFAKDLTFLEKPKIICIFDNDDEGRTQLKKIKPQYAYLNIEIISLPRHDGKVVSLKDITDNKKQFEDWEIEDFIPVDLIIDAANQMLRKDNYRAISKGQRNNRDAAAHKSKYLLKYLSECTTHNNSEKESYDFDTQARKRELCKTFCSITSSERIIESLSQEQKDFLNKLIG